MNGRIRTVSGCIAAGLVAALSLTPGQGPRCVAAEDRPWHEPAWQEKGDRQVRLRFRFTRCRRTEYQETQHSKITTAGKATKLDISCTKVLTVESVAGDGTARVTTSLERTTVKAGRKARPWLGPIRGRFSIRPTGRMEEVSGIVDQRSLPTFPPAAVKIGSKWTAPMAFAGALDDPTAVAQGQATYTLAGLATVGGHDWARITFQGDLVLARRRVTQKVIGVKYAHDRPPPAAKPGAAVTEVVRGSPADRAGLQAGDRIIEFAAQTVENWQDLLYAVAVAPAAKPAAVIIVRDGARKKLTVTPRSIASFEAEAKGTFKGVVVFDVTAGRVIRGELNPLTATVTLFPDGRKIRQQFLATAVTQLRRTPAAPAPGGEGKAVRKLAEAYVAAYAAPREPPTAKLQKLLAEDFTSAYSNGRATQGRKAALDVYRAAMAEIRQAFRTWSVSLQIRSLRVWGDAAVVFGTVTMSGRLKDGDKPFRKEVWETLIFRKDAGRWRLIHEHATVRAPDPPKPAPSP